MAQFREPAEPEIKAWHDWVAERPDAVRLVAERFNPWTLYRLTTTGHRVSLYSFGETEDGGVTMTVDVLGRFNVVAFERRVFGIDPDDLVECDLPADDEMLGSADMDPQDAMSMSPPEDLKTLEVPHPRRIGRMDGISE